LLFAGIVVATNAAAVEFDRDRVQGILNLDVSYGITYRLDNPDNGLIGIANGGTEASVNSDDGELNQKRGVVSQMVRGTAELILAFDNFGVYARAVAFDDWVADGNLARTKVTATGRELVGSDVNLLERYVAGSFAVAGTPVYFRIGDQVLTWQGTSFVRDGLDMISPFDGPTALQPATRAIDSRDPVGMVWIASSLTDVIAVEGYYQYGWKPVVLEPVGTVFSTLDLYGGDGVHGHGAFLGGGQISDLGTDLDQQFALPPGTLGFDPQYERIPGRTVNQPSDRGQYGISVFARFLDRYATKIGVNYMRYNSRLPIVSGLTGDAAAVAATSAASVAALAADLAPIYVGEGFDAATAATTAVATAQALTLSHYMNQAGYLIEFPEHIDVLGASFSFSSLGTGTLVSGEIARHFNFPYQLATDAVLRATLSPVEFNPNIGTTGLGEFGPDAVIHGYRRADRAQGALGIQQLLGPRAHAAQMVIDFDVGWVHVYDRPSDGDVPLAGIDTANSWGYRLALSATYNSLFGGVNLIPRLIYSHDVSGSTPAPTATFVEGRRLLSLGATFSYLERVEVDLAFTQFSGAGSANQLRDRDFAQARFIYFFR
jgi:hypothetical protein